MAKGWHSLDETLHVAWVQRQIGGLDNGVVPEVM